MEIIDMPCIRMKAFQLHFIFWAKKHWQNVGNV